jgi:hypothetical protein
MDFSAYNEHQDQMLERMSEGSSGEQKYVKKRPKYFPTNGQGKLIQNAITGVEYPWRVGSNDARRLFRVVDTTGVYDNQGRRLKPNATDCPNPNPNPNHCYYDSPQQFMTHRKMTLQPQLLAHWQAVQQEFASV